MDLDIYLIGCLLTFMLIFFIEVVRYQPNQKIIDPFIFILLVMCWFLVLPITIIILIGFSIYQSIRILGEIFYKYKKHE